MSDKRPRAKFRGLHHDRYDREPAELAAAMLWQSQHDGCLSPGILPHLLGDGQTPYVPTERDWLVAATVVQWLASPVGRAFVRALAEATQTKDLP